MKKNMIVLAGLLAFLGVLVTPAGAISNADNDQFNIPKSYNGFSDANLKNAGTEHCAVGTSTAALTGVVCYNGAGVLYGISMASGTAENFLVAFDTGNVAAWSLTSDMFVTQFGSALTSKVFTQATASSSCVGPANCGRLTFDPPIRFSNGLTILQNTANTSAVIYYRKR